MVRNEHWIADPGETIVMERGLRRPVGMKPSSPEWQRTTACTAVEAIGRLCAHVLKPLEFGVTRHLADEFGEAMPDPHDVPTPWNWYVRTPRTPAFAHPFYVDAQIVDAAQVDEPTMYDVVDLALTEPCDVPDGRWVAWTEMYVWDTLARVPEPDRLATDRHLVLDDYDNRHLDVRIPVTDLDGDTWVGATLGVRTPFIVRLDKGFSDRADAGDFDQFLHLDVSVNWTLWSRPATAGRRMLDQALDDLRRTGWQQTFPRPAS